MALILLAACQGKEEGRTDAIWPGMTLHVPLAKSGSVCELEQLFSEWRFVPLEMNDSALVSDVVDIGRILIQGEQIYLANWREIMLFDRQGHFRRKLNHYGQGPGEYLSICNFALRKDGTVVLQEDIRGGNRLFIYDRKSKEIVHAYYPVKQLHVRYLFHDYFSYYGDEILFGTYCTSEVYGLSADSCRLRYVVDIDGRRAPDGFWSQDKEDIAIDAEYVRRGYIDHIPFFMESDQRILLYYMGGREELQGYAWIDKQSGEVHSFKQFAFDPSFRWQPEYLYPQADGTVVIPIPAYLLFEQEATELISRFPGLNEESNPVLFIGKLK